MDTIVKWFSGVSENIGITRDPVVDMVILLVALSIIGMLFAVISVARRDTSQRPTGAYEGRGLAARLEKLEMAFNALKTEVARANQLSRGELGYLMQELQQIKHQLGDEEASAADSSVEEDGFTRPAAMMGPEGEDSTIEADFEETALAVEGESVGQADGLEPETPVAIDTSLESTEKKTEEIARPASLIDRLQKTRAALFGRISSLFSGGVKLDERAFSDLEELLIGADLGVKTTTGLIDEIRQETSSGRDMTEAALVELIKTRIHELLEKDAPLAPGIMPVKQDDGPFVVLLVGVNGTGKTTTAAKLASQWKEEGRKVLLVAADTYRAAAVEQLCEWGARIGVPVYRGVDQAKPGTVVFDGMEKAHSEGFDTVIVDTAGRLHTKSNLMQELEGVRNLIQRKQGSAPHETVLVVDGATGQNAVSQAKEFNGALGLTGIIVTKLDGTPKGGVVVAIKNEFGIPVRYIGVGEASADLQPFIAREFVEALFTA